MKQSGCRFLIQNELTGEYNECNDNIAREKISHGFRNLRMKKDTTSTTTTITGDGVGNGKTKSKENATTTARKKPTTTSTSSRKRNFS